MVSVNVPTVRMGLPPDPSKPQCPYPGVSPTAFDGNGALAAYRKMCQKDKDSRRTAQVLGKKLMHDGDDPLDCIGDLIPGYKAVERVYKRIGFVRKDGVGWVKPDNFEQIMKEEERSRKSKGARSATSATEPSPPLAPVAPGICPCCGRKKRPPQGSSQLVGLGRSLSTPDLGGKSSGSCLSEARPSQLSVAMRPKP
eukprot:gnl/TRDRNA2_/TRDRNA2_184722_c0_seq1.p1 gnl/TRDRNA2_/TRDRNA2_184722_c0~~gnl/TRDRNA2_/TRDRNA2_184722_c0_seq1.p1  ORF type:complete len:197 (+),score=29.59 gnl/TRDRNA2_/TRDRNA2_184722_c0_seq1:76-666(+)